MPNDKVKMGADLVLPDQPQILEPKKIQMADNVRDQLKAQVDIEWQKILKTLPPPPNKELMWAPNVHVKKIDGGMDVSIKPQLAIKPEFA